MYSQDGKWLYMSSNLGVYAYDTASYKNIRLVSSIPYGTLSPDGKFVATREAVFSVDSGQKLELELFVFSGFKREAFTNSAETIFSSDSSLIARYYSGIGTVVWRLADRKLINMFKGKSIKFSADNRLIVIGRGVQDILGQESSYHIYLYDLQTGEQLHDWISPGERLAFLSDNSLVAEADGYTRIYDPETHTVRHGFEGTFAAFSPDEKLIATLLSDHIKIYRVSDGQALHRLEAGSSLDRADLRFSADGQILAGFTVDAQCCSGHIDHLALWRVADGTLIKGLKPCPEFYFSPDSQTILACGQVLRTSDGSLIADLPHVSTGMVTNLAFTPDGQQIIVACHQNLYLYPVDSGSIWLPQRADPETYQPILQAASPNNYYGLPFDWEPPDGQKEVLSPDGKLVARRKDGIVTVWNASGEGGAFYVPATGVTRLAFSPDGQILALGLRDSSLELWSLTNRQKVYTVPARTSVKVNFVGGLAFSPDGKFLAVGLEDGTVRLFEIDVR